MSVMYGTGAEKLSLTVDASGALTSVTGPMIPLIFMIDRSFASVSSDRYRTCRRSPGG